jgi:hypothetical protein
MEKIPAKDAPFEGALPVGNASISVGAEAGNVIRASIQLSDSNWQDLKHRGHVMAYLSNDAYGDSIVTSAPTGGVAVGVDGLCMPLITNKYFALTSESDGDIDLDITDSGTPTMYLIICLPNGRLVASAAITFA